MGCVMASLRDLGALGASIPDGMGWGMASLRDYWVGDSFRFYNSLIMFLKGDRILYFFFCWGVFCSCDSNGLMNEPSSIELVDSLFIDDKRDTILDKTEGKGLGLNGDMDGNSGDVLDEGMDSESSLTDTCHCEEKESRIPQYTDLTFSNNRRSFVTDSLSSYQGARRFSIKSLTLVDFDTIPKEFGIFPNVETVVLENINHRNVVGLDVFKNLKRLRLSELRLDIPPQAEWPEKIVVLEALKTEISGIENFSRFRNMKYMDMSFSGFDRFPEGFENMECLQFFTTGAHRFGDIDLSTIDLSGLDCLLELKFHTWYDNMVGIPKGIEEKKNKAKLNIHHQKLTDAEKQILK